MERYAPRYDPRALTFLQMATSFVGFTVIALALGELEVPHGGTVWGALLVTGVFAGALGYLIATWVQARTTAARAALVFTLEAPFAALFGVLLADEVLGWAGWLGCAVMMAGILLAEPAAAATLRRLAAGRRASMDAVVLALVVGGPLRRDDRRVRIALRARRAAEVGALFTIVLVALAVIVAAARRATGTSRTASGRSCSRGCSRPGSRSSSSRFAVREAGAVADVGRRRDGAALLGRDRARLPRRAARRGARRRRALIVAGGILLASERDRPEHFKRDRARLALVGDGRLRDARQPRPLARDRHRRRARRWPRSPRCSPARPSSLALFVVVGRERRSAARRCVASLPAGRLLRPLVRLPLRGVLPRPVSVVSPLVATESLWGVALSALVLAAVRARRAAARRRRRARRRWRRADRRLPLAGLLLDRVETLLDPRRASR